MGGRVQKPPTTPREREDRIISMAFDAVEQRIRDGTVTGQELGILIKAGMEKSQLELELMHKQKELMDAKTEALQSSKRIEELYSQAMSALKSYGGGPVDD